MKKKRFVAGDILKCVDGEHTTLLNLGEHYIFEEYVVGLGIEYVRVKNQDGSMEGDFYPERFKKVEVK